jgi:hypothetical protein
LAFGANTYVAVGDVILQSSLVTNAPVPPPSLAIRSYPGVSITGTVGRKYRIEYSEDLRLTNNFTALTNLSLTMSPYLWVDTSYSNSAPRFYRAVLLP